MAADAKTEFLVTAKDATAAAFGSVEKGLGKIGSALGSMQSAILGAVGIGGLGALVKSSMDATDALAKASDRLGITTEALAGLRYAGDLAGVSAEQLDSGLGKMSKTLNDAARGMSTADESIRALGLSTEELLRMPTDQAFMRIGDALMDVDNNMQRLALTQEIFGKGATGIINLMAEGSEGMAAATREAQALGLALSRVDAAKIEIANDSFTRIKSVFAGIGNTIAVQLSPYIQGIGDWLVKSSTEADGFRSHIQVAMENAAKAVGFLADMFRGLHVVWKLLQQGWYELENVVIQGIDGIANGLRSIASLLPGIDIKPDANLKKWAVDSAEGVKNTRAELEALAMAPMPSQGIEEFFAKLKQLNAEAAAATAARGAGMAGAGDITQSPGIGDKEAEQTAKYEAALQKQLEALYNSTAPKLEVMAMDQAMKQALIDEGYLTGLLSEQMYYEQSALLHQQYQEKVTAEQTKELAKRYGQQATAQAQIAALMQGSFNQQLQGIAGMLGQASQLMMSGKKKEFELGKKAAIGQALVNTYLSVSSALAMTPFPVGLVMGAIALATGLMNVNRIRSQKFGGSGGASPTFNANPGTGIPEPAAAPTPIAPSLPQGAATGAAAARNVNITIESDSGMVSTEWVRDSLIPVLNEASGDGVSINMMPA